MALARWVWGTRGDRFVMFCSGLCLGFCFVGDCGSASALVAVHGRTLAAAWPSGVAHMIHSLLSAALAAAIVAVIEEILFRGALFGVVRKAMPWQGAPLR